MSTQDEKPTDLLAVTDTRKNLFVVDIETERGCSADDGELGVSISRIVNGCVRELDWSLVYECILNSVEELDLPDEGLTSVVVVESGEREEDWVVFYELRGKLYGAPLDDGAAMDEELRAWLATASEDDERDVIVEAVLPRTGAAPKSIKSVSTPYRDLILVDLESELWPVKGVTKIRILKAAGAIVVRASAKGIQTIAEHPIVKAIRSNRDLL